MSSGRSKGSSFMKYQGPFAPGRSGVDQTYAEFGPRCFPAARGFRVRADAECCSHATGMCGEWALTCVRRRRPRAPTWSRVSEAHPPLAVEPRERGVPAVDGRQELGASRLNEHPWSVAGEARSAGAEG